MLGYLSFNASTALIFLGESSVKKILVYPFLICFSIQSDFNLGLAPATPTTYGDIPCCVLKK